MNQNKSQAISAGYICLDISPLFNRNKKVTQVNELFTPGKLIETGHAEIFSGGSAANTGLAMAQLGLDVTLIGKIGEDFFGKILLDSLAKHKVNQKMILSKEDTSYSVVLAPPGFDRMFLHYPGANNSFSAEDLDYPAISQAALFHFGYPNLMKGMYHNKGRELITMYSQIDRSGVVTSLDMALADPESEAGKVNWREILPNLLPHVDIFAPSIDEILSMLCPREYRRWKLEAQNRELIEVIDIKKDLQPLVKELMDWGTKILLIKCGAPGLFYKTNGVEALSKLQKKTDLEIRDWACQQGFEPGFKASQVLSTTGAGDASIAGFLTAFLKQKSLKHCIETAAAAGAASVEAYDTVGGVPAYEKLRERIESGWEKQPPLL